MSTTLYIFCGLPFSGKTQLAQEISEITGAKIVSSDAIYWEKLQEMQKINMNSKPSWGEAIVLMKKRVLALLSKDQSVIADNANYLLQQRVDLAKIAQDRNISYLVVYLNLPIEVLRSRMEENNTSQDRLPVNEDTFRKHLKILEKPIKNENVVELKSENDIETWIQLLK